MTKLQEYLTRNDIRQSAFAVAVGASQATISKLASGSMRPGLDLAIAIERLTDGAVPVASWVRPTPGEEAA